MVRTNLDSTSPSKKFYLQRAVIENLLWRLQNITEKVMYPLYLDRGVMFSSICVQVLVAQLPMLAPAIAVFH